MHQPSLANLHAYALAWSEPDTNVAKRLLRESMSEDCEIVGPGYHFKGITAVLAEVERFHREQPGVRAVVTSAFDTHGQWTRFTIAMLAPDGTKTHDGWDIVELDRSGLVRRVITFWGSLAAQP